MSLLKNHFSLTRSVIEQEDLTLKGELINACLCLLSFESAYWMRRLILFVVFSVSDSCFLSCNDLTHSLSSYLKEGKTCLFMQSFNFLKG